MKKLNTHTELRALSEALASLHQAQSITELDTRLAEVFVMIFGKNKPRLGQPIGATGAKPELTFSPEETLLWDLLHTHYDAVYNRLAAILEKKCNGFDKVATHLRRRGVTERESEVFRWICAGKRDKEIATILGLSPWTVRTHVRNLFVKLAVETRTAIIAQMRELLDFVENCPKIRKFPDTHGGEAALGREIKYLI
jgi:DNA-binding CsgD family transcriptional regulator